MTPQAYNNDGRFLYTGFFIPGEAMSKINFYLDKRNQLNRKRLPLVIANPHVTVSFKPDQIYPELFGQRCRLIVTKYANDGKNEGIAVKICPQRIGIDNDTLQLLNYEINQILIPHVTLSVGYEAKPADTALLDFKYLDTEFTIDDVRYGGFTTDRKIILSKTLCLDQLQEPIERPDERELL